MSVNIKYYMQEIVSKLCNEWCNKSKLTVIVSSNFKDISTFKRHSERERPVFNASLPKCLKQPRIKLKSPPCVSEN